MSKERLEEISERVIVDKVYYKYLDGTKGHWGKTYTLSEEDYSYLIEQAERVQELEEELYGNDIQMGYKSMYETCNRDYTKLLQQNKRYREALGFYAEGKHVAYKLDETDDDLVADYGETARKALEGEE